MSSDAAIRVRNLSKCYQVYERPQHRLKQMIYPRLSRLAGLRTRQYFREFWALRDVDLDVGRGEAFASIDPLVRRYRGKTVLEGVALAVSATVAARAAQAGMGLREAAEQLIR